MTASSATDRLDLIDAHSPGLGKADFIFVFGTAHATPVDGAGELFRRGLAPFVVVTGGENRSRPGHIEADHHRDLLLTHGVPASAIVVERQSRYTVENVGLAAPLIEERVSSPRVAIAVVKWYHRRALVALAAGVRSVERIYTAAYDPRNDGGAAITRENWTKTARSSIERERRYMHELVETGADVLVRSEEGWLRSRASA